ncbi:hypothetical protein GCM10025864_41030 [Luteimicrobium album]|uniref:Uncharacterized protein n=1 Tax=Luteimicrobium album TaxID=1054550 RepID=A0ABQ6I9F6_9MICO|nr:hypothetical protein GCM10025864_41030 [Luteimicrobium album]
MHAEPEPVRTGHGDPGPVGVGVDRDADGGLHGVEVVALEAEDLGAVERVTGRDGVHGHPARGEGEDVPVAVVGERPPAERGDDGEPGVRTGGEDDGPDDESCGGGHRSSSVAGGVAR